MIFLNTWRFLIKQMCGSFNESFQVLGQKGLWSSTEYTSSVVLICIDLKNYPMNILQKTTCWITQQQARGPCIETSQEFLWYAYLQVYTLNNSYVNSCHNKMLSYLCVISWKLIFWYGIPVTKHLKICIYRYMWKTFAFQ